MAFKKGSSGNPKGRKAGLPDRRTALRQLIEPLIPSLIEVVHDMALAGDVAACRLLLDKCCANLKPEMQAEPIAVNMAGTATEQCQSILDAIAAGSLAADTGSQLIRAIADTVKVYDSTELLKRLDELESGVKK